MPKTYKLSCTIIAFNEEDRIARCLESVVGIADEIIVVDSGSTDKTVEICESYGARCFYNEWVGFGQQKRFAEELASNHWILNLDADEWLTDDAREEIRNLISRGFDEGIYGYKLTIRQLYPFEEKPRLFADCHEYVRLYNKELCRFPDSSSYDEIKIESKNTGKLISPVYHRSIRSISHLIEKNILYYRLQAQEIGLSRRLSVVRVVFEPLTVFVKYYFMKRHFTGGVYGFIVASTIAVIRTYSC